MDSLTPSENVLGKLLDFKIDEEYGKTHSEWLQQIGEYEMKYTLMGEVSPDPKAYYHRHVIDELAILKSRVIVLESENQKVRQDFRDLCSELLDSMSNNYSYRQQLIDRLTTFSQGY